MGFGQALHQVISERGENQSCPARVANVSPAYISKIIRATRKPPKDVIRSTTTHYDEPFLYIEAANEATGGAWVPWLTNADLHRANTHIKSLEELEEAQAALMAAPITKRKDQLGEADREKIKVAIMECLEAITALTHHVAILCKEYAFSWMGVWKDHRVKLKASKYLK